MAIATQIRRRWADFLPIGLPVVRNPALRPGLSQAGLANMHHQTAKNRRFDGTRRKIRNL
jgi:hypothetical protein